MRGYFITFYSSVSFFAHDSWHTSKKTQEKSVTVLIEQSHRQLLLANLDKSSDREVHIAIHGTSIKKIVRCYALSCGLG